MLAGPQMLALQLSSNAVVTPIWMKIAATMIADPISNCMVMGYVRLRFKSGLFYWVLAGCAMIVRENRRRNSCRAGEIGALRGENTCSWRK